MNKILNYYKFNRIIYVKYIYLLIIIPLTSLICSVFVHLMILILEEKLLVGNCDFFFLSKKNQGLLFLNYNGTLCTLLYLDLSPIFNYVFIYLYIS